MSTIVTTTAKAQSISFSIESDETFMWFESSLWGDLNAVIEWSPEINVDRVWDVENEIRIVHGSHYEPPLVAHSGMLSTVTLAPGPYQFDYQVNASKWDTTTEQWGVVVLERSSVAYVPEPDFGLLAAILVGSLIGWIVASWWKRK